MIKERVSLFYFNNDLNNISVLFHRYNCFKGSDKKNFLREFVTNGTQSNGYCSMKKKCNE